MQLASAVRSAVVASLAIVSFAGLQAMPALADVLFDGSFPLEQVDDIGFNDPDAGGQRLAEDFQVTSLSTMTGVRFVGGYYPSNTPQDDSFTLTILGDAAGLPDPSNVIAELPLTVERNDTGVFALGVRLYSYAAQFSGVPLEGNTPYWFLIVNDTSNDPNDDWVWAGGHQGGVYARSFDGGLSWVDTVAGNFDFQVLGDQGPTAVESSSWGRVKALYR
ncbi:MAG: hypothetical protein ACE15D_17670 [Candidatus Eisenbacteria bacterium]|nr:hypothetical protein [Candidatus Eisenbacteria bacterium]